MKKITLWMLAAIMLFATGVLTAQSESPYSITRDLPGIAGATAYLGAPPGFDPTTASQEDLQGYGYPRRPDSNDTKPYAAWLRAVSAPRIDPELVPNPGRFHRPNQQIATSSTVKNTTKTQSGNWSGYSLVGGSPVFTEVVGLWIVPNVGKQFRKLTGYSSMWVGIDGNCACDDLIQDGTAQEWVNGAAQYYAWIEFIPKSEVLIKNFPVAPGDVIYATSSVGTKNGVVTGFYFMTNYNTNKSVSTSLPIPSGTTFSGKSAEWVVERTEVDGSFKNPLPYYAFAYMDNAWAYRGTSSKTITYLSQANQNITMVNGSHKLSDAYEQDSDSMWFEWLAYQ